MENEKNKVARGSVIAAFFLTTFKIIVGILTGSLGILSEALHSLLDLLAAGITWYAVRVSDKPADNDHHFGHGKIENLSALIETILLLVTSIWIIYEAISRLVSQETHIEVTFWSFAVMGTSIVIDFVRSRALMRVAKKHNSQALEADALHFSTDIWSSSVVIVGLIAAKFEFYMADSIAALAVAFIVILVSYRLGKRAVNVLLDRVPAETFHKIRAVVTKIESVRYFHDLRVRESGADTFVELSIHVEPGLGLEESHKIADLVEAEIKLSVPRCFVHVHTEPDHPGK